MADELTAAVAAARKETAEAIAADLRTQADDEAARPGRGCCSRAIETWLRQAAETAESYADPTGADRG